MQKKKRTHRSIKGCLVAPRPVLPGVWRRPEGGCLVRGKALDPRTGRRREVLKILAQAEPPEAYQWLQAQLRSIREGEAPNPEARGERHGREPLVKYGARLLEQKTSCGEIRSAAGVDKWTCTLRRLALSPLGELYVCAIRPADVLAWRAAGADLVQAGKESPWTFNTDLSVLKVILKHAKLELELPQNAAADVPPLDCSQHCVYTRESPNALTASELRAFLAALRLDYPQHYAFAFVGFAPGLRPSSIRPLRRQGPSPDVLWEERQLLVRQSNSRSDLVMVGTKTGRCDVIDVPEELLEVLRWHVDTQLLPGPERESELLFPSETGGFRSRSCLIGPFKKVAKAIGLTKPITPRAMRRSFQDLARQAQVADVVTRSISGHATERMQRHYSTVSPTEQVEGLAKVIQLMDRAKAGSGAPTG